MYLIVNKKHGYVVEEHETEESAKESLKHWGRAFTLEYKEETT